MDVLAPHRDFILVLAPIVDHNDVGVVGLVLLV
jgi:hypothetical protein